MHTRFPVKFQRKRNRFRCIAARSICFPQKILRFARYALQISARISVRIPISMARFHSIVCTRAALSLSVCDWMIQNIHQKWQCWLLIRQSISLPKCRTFDQWTEGNDSQRPNRYWMMINSFDRGPQNIHTPSVSDNRIQIDSFCLFDDDNDDDDDEEPPRTKLD